MISKEKFLNGYIENDQGKLRELWMTAAAEFGFDFTWIDESFIFDGIEDALDCKYCFICDNAVDSGDQTRGKCQLTIEDFVNTDNKITAGDIQKTFKEGSDIFQQMLTLAKQHNMFIQFDGFTQDENNAIVVTKQGSDTEYVIQTQEQFNQLVESFSVLEKFERK